MYKDIKSKKKKITFCMYQFITGGIERSLVELLQNLSQYKQYKFSVVVEKPITEKIYNDFFKNNEFDVFIVGSDQVFRHSFVKKEKGIYYLSFVNKKRKKIAYAASFGIAEFDGNKKDKKKVKSYLTSFDALSVREADGINILKKDFGLDSIHVLDPVFMIDWDHLTTDFKYDDKVYYILNPDLRYLAKNNMLGSSLTIEQWLSAIKNSDLVVTDSFHGICFCLLFKKKFVALAHRNSPISRLYSLFDMFSLPKDKIVFNDMVGGKQNLEDYIIEIANIDEELTKWRKISYDFILQAIGD